MYSRMTGTFTPEISDQEIAAFSDRDLDDPRFQCDAPSWPKTHTEAQCHYCDVQGRYGRTITAYAAFVSTEKFRFLIGPDSGRRAMVEFDDEDQAFSEEWDCCVSTIIGIGECLGMTDYRKVVDTFRHRVLARINATSPQEKYKLDLDAWEVSSTEFREKYAATLPESELPQWYDAGRAAEFVELPDELKPKVDWIEDCKNRHEHKHTYADTGEVRRQQQEFGWGWSDDYIELHESPAARKKFRSSCRMSPSLEYFEDFVNQMNNLS